MEVKGCVERGLTWVEGGKGIGRGLKGEGGKNGRKGGQGD